MRKPKLKHRQRVFCDKFIKNGGNGTRAAIAAGYSKKTAYSIANENLKKPDIKKYIEMRVEEIAQKIGLSDEYLFQKLKDGIDYSMPSDAKIEGILQDDTISSDFKKMKLSQLDIRAAVTCISEVNKMLGKYPKEQSNINDVEQREKIKDTVKEHEREF